MRSFLYWRNDFISSLASGVAVVGGNAIAEIPRIVQVTSSDPGFFAVELRGNPAGWTTGESYRLMFGYSQADGRPFTRWWNALCDVMQVIYNPGSDSTEIYISGLGSLAGQGTFYPINSSYLNGRTISVAGSLTSQFTIEDSFLQAGGSILYVDGNASHVIEPNGMISIGAREDAYQGHANAFGSYIFNGDTTVYDNLNRQYQPDISLWNSYDKIGPDNFGNSYSYCSNYFKGIDLLGLDEDSSRTKPNSRCKDDVPVPVEKLIDRGGLDNLPVLKNLSLGRRSRHEERIPEKDREVQKKKSA